MSAAIKSDSAVFNLVSLTKLEMENFDWGGKWVMGFFNSDFFCVLRLTSFSCSFRHSRIFFFALWLFVLTREVKCFLTTYSLHSLFLLYNLFLYLYCRFIWHGRHGCVHGSMRSRAFGILVKNRRLITSWNNLMSGLVWALLSRTAEQAQPSAGRFISVSLDKPAGHHRVGTHILLLDLGKK